MLEARTITLGFEGRALFAPVSLQLAPGQICGLTGPSGCGKSTFGRGLAGLHPLLGGALTVNGLPLTSLPRPLPVFYLAQNPRAVMNPRWSVAKILAEAGRTDPGLAAELGVRAEWSGRYAHELSGGELQRVALLRALSAGPRLLIADEITEALDPLSQAAIWAALTRLVSTGRIGLLVISHNAALLERLLGPGQSPLRLQPPRAERIAGGHVNPVPLAGGPHTERLLR